jgi:hypothetical protein
MGWRDRKPQPQTELGALLKRIEDAETRIRSLAQTGPTSLQLIDIDDYEDDLANVDIGEVHVNWPGVHRPAKRYDPAVYFHDEKWRSLGSNAAVYEIKVFEDDKPNLVKSRAFVWEIPADLDGAYIKMAGGFVTTTGGDTEVDITNDIGGGSVFGSNIVIPGGSRSSRYGTSPQAPGNGYGPVNWGDQLAINTVAAGGMGLGVWVLVLGAGVGGVLLDGLKGEKGDPGGIDNFTGAYNSGTAYNTGDAVSNNGSSYVAIAPSTGIEPGVTAGWETSWMALSEFARNSTIMLTISAGVYVIATGIKGSTPPMPYGGTIRGATLLADKAGDASVDIWKTNYAGYAPTVANSITGGNPLTLGGGIKTQTTALTGWDTSVAPGDIFMFYVMPTPTVVNLLTLGLDVERT